MSKDEKFNYGYWQIPRPSGRDKGDYPPHVERRTDRPPAEPAAPQRPTGPDVGPADAADLEETQRQAEKGGGNGPTV